MDQPEESPQKLPFRTYLSLQANTSLMNETFNRLFGKCNSVYLKKYYSYRRTNKDKSSIAYLKDDQDLEIVFRSYSDVITYCLKKSAGLLEELCKPEINAYH